MFSFVDVSIFLIIFLFCILILSLFDFYILEYKVVILLGIIFIIIMFL